MTDKPQRPESFEFALDFLGDPEASDLRAYIEQLEARAVLARYGHQRDALGDCLTAGLDQSFTTEATNDNPHNYHTQAD